MENGFQFRQQRDAPLVGILDGGEQFIAVPQVALHHCEGGLTHLLQHPYRLDRRLRTVGVEGEFLVAVVEVVAYRLDLALVVLLGLGLVELPERDGPRGDGRSQRQRQHRGEVDLFLARSLVELRLS